MEIKAPHPERHADGFDLPALVRTYVHANQLKHLYRQGWLRAGVGRELCESVADHSYGVALLAMLLADQLAPELDTERLLRMALLHDLGEAHVGDITPAMGITKQVKVERERRAVQTVLAGLPAADVYLELWDAYEACACPESRFIKAIDRFEMALQARIYEGETGLDLTEFYQSAAPYLQGPDFSDLFQKLHAWREWSPK